MMRKGIVLIGVIISIIAMCVVCNAETMVRHDVAGFDISVEIPEDWYYVDRATEEDDPVINGIRMSLEEIRENFEGNNFAFFAYIIP